MKVDHGLLVTFRNRWQSVKALEVKEIRNLSMKQKLQQLGALIYLARGLDVNFQEDEETVKVRKRWVSLKKKMSNT